ncbi:hypothetical protein ACK3TF_005126 [Chlorella vulgaris]
MPPLPLSPPPVAAAGGAAGSCATMPCSQRSLELLGDSCAATGIACFFRSQLTLNHGPLSKRASSAARPWLLAVSMNWHCCTKIAVCWMPPSEQSVTTVRSYSLCRLPDFRSASMTSFKRGKSGFMELLLQLAVDPAKLERELSSTSQRWSPVSPPARLLPCPNLNPRAWTRQERPPQAAANSTASADLCAAGASVSPLPHSSADELAHHMSVVVAAWRASTPRTTQQGQA